MAVSPTAKRYSRSGVTSWSTSAGHGLPGADTRQLTPLCSHARPHVGSTLWAGSAPPARAAAPTTCSTPGGSRRRLQEVHCRSIALHTCDCSDAAAANSSATGRQRHTQTTKSAPRKRSERQRIDKAVAYSQAYSSHTMFCAKSSRTWSPPCHRRRRRRRRCASWLTLGQNLPGLGCVRQACMSGLSASVNGTSASDTRAHISSPLFSAGIF